MESPSRPFGVYLAAAVKEFKEVMELFFIDRRPIAVEMIEQIGFWISALTNFSRK